MTEKEICNVTETPAEVGVSPQDPSVRGDAIAKNTSCNSGSIINQH